MNTLKPPRLAMALLRRCLSDHEPLVGDLLEEFARRQSRWWFWAQLLGAIVVTGRQRRRTAEVRPLQLLDERLSPLTAIDRSPLKPFVNLTASPVHGTGGLGILSLLVLSTALAPGIWSLVITGVMAGVVLGWVRIIRARRHGFATTESVNHIFTGR